MSKYTDITIDGVVLPPADESGLTITPQTIWSQNAGRISSTGKFVGDIKAIKYDVQYKRSRCTQEEFDIINNAVNNLQSIHSVSLCLPDEHNNPSITKDFYVGSGTFSYTIKRFENVKSHYSDTAIYENVSFELIEV
ncbi:MAG: hypothetical protein ACI4RC_04310 [Oscillospiraceae bacterium]